MFLQPLRQNNRRQRVSNSRALPPPVGGLNSFDAITDMPEQDALVLTNYFCQPDYVELRNGYESHATGLGATVHGLFTWRGPATEKMFGAVATDIYEVSSSGAVGAADVTSLTNGKWQDVMMATSGGNFLVIANGADSIRNYDGSSWTTPTITGVSSATIDNLAVHARRLWMVEENSTSAWYLPVDSIAGAALEFDLGPEFLEGGKLQAIGTLTRDGGNGPDDFAVFLSSNGEAVIYRGTDPASANTWAKVGTFRVPEPIGQRCLIRLGSDMAVLTKSGVISLTTMLALDRSVAERAAVTNKINALVTRDAINHATKFGWQLAFKPNANMMLLNVPTAEDSAQCQYVMNTLTGAWSKFTGWNGASFALFSGDLYFGGNSGTVWKADSTLQDNGGGIVGDLKTAFSYFGSKGRDKNFKLMRSIYESNGSPGVLMDLNIDFEDREPTSSPSPTAPAGSLWGTAVWGTATWGSGNKVRRDWQGANGHGESVAVRQRVVSDGASFKLYGFDLMAELGDPL